MGKENTLQSAYMENRFIEDPVALPMHTILYHMDVGGNYMHVFFVNFVNICTPRYFHLLGM